MDRPKSMVVDSATFADGEEKPFLNRNNYFYVTVPGLPDGRPFKFCEYRHRSSMVKETRGGVITRTYKLWW